MFKTGDEAVETARILKDLVAGVTEVDIMIAPPYTALLQVADVVKDSPIALGGQNLHWEAEGAFTGEVSATMLISAGCRYVIIGHSERRQFFGEIDESVNKKIRTAMANNLVPVFCIGESEQERESDLTFSVLDKQVKVGLQNIASDELATLIIAYEPVWAIGTGKTATSGQAQEVHAFLRTLLQQEYGNEFAESIRILYGGSVKPNNTAELMSMPDVDGALVGGASLDAVTFSKIVCY
jgi:triosephosphate isomerase